MQPTLSPSGISTGGASARSSARFGNRCLEHALEVRNRPGRLAPADCDLHLVLGQIGWGNLEQHLASFACLQVHALKPAQLPDEIAITCKIQLHDFVPLSL